MIKESELIKKTKRLVLRPVKKTDYRSWKQSNLERLPKQNEFDKGPPREDTLTKDLLGSWVDRNRLARKKDLVYTFGIFDKKTGLYMGLVNFAIISRLSYQFANLGYELHNQFWGKGYAPEAIKGALEIAFSKLKLNRVEAGIEPHNHASIRVCEKLNMTKEGMRKKYFFNGEKWVDLLYFSINSEGFGKKSKKPIIKPSLNDYL